jgi:hypothetical protein
VLQEGYSLLQDIGEFHPEPCLWLGASLRG